MVLVALLSLSFLGVQAESRGWWILSSAETAERATIVAAAVTLTVALLGVEAARQRWRASRDAQTVNAALVTVVLAALVVAPQFAFSSSSPVIDGLSLAGHLLAILVVGSFLWRPESMVDATTRMVIAICTAIGITIASALVLAPQISRHSGSSEAFAVIAFTLIAIIWFTASYISIKRSFSNANRRQRWLALLYLAMAVAAASQVSTITDPKPSVFASITLLLGFVAVLYATVVELAQTVIIERDRSALAQSETNLAVGRLVEQTRAHADAVHNTRNAIAAIDGGLRMLAKQPSPADQEWLLDSLRSEMRRLYEIMQRPQSEGVVERFDVREVILPMITCYRLAEHPVSLTAEIGVWALGRAGDTAEVVQNLIHNSLRHAAGSAIEVSIATRNNEVVISVADDGIGIDSSESKSIFEMGYRSPNSTGFGQGAGLSSCRLMMQAQNGDVELLDTESPGATFEVRLPRATSTDPYVIDLTDDAAAARRLASEQPFDMPR